MNRHTHTAISVASGLFACTLFNLPVVLVVSGCLNSAMLPDIDLHFHALRHRGITHSLLLPIVLSCCAIGTTGSIHYIIIGLIIGLLSHIIADLFNGKGVEIFYPCKRNFSLADIKYNGKGEDIIRIVAYCYICYSLLMNWTSSPMMFN